MSYFVDVSSKNFTLERTSGAQGDDNPGGFGWLMVYDDGAERREIIIPDNVMREWAAYINFKIRHDQGKVNADAAV